MQVCEIMSTQVIRISQDTKAIDALRLMVEHRIDGLPIVDDANQVIGIITYADLLRRVRRMNPHAVDLFLFAMLITEEDKTVEERVKRILQQPVSKLCTRHVVTCTPDENVADIAGLMVDHRVKRLPVVESEEHPRLVGIISRHDIMRAIWEQNQKTQ